ncbi:SLC13 family permease [Luteimonas sp. 8-5]|uniref:SLC13 family permease n=1 Tax=Luteimonas sp. 8-5 TaxID=3039387 RepID=UPI0024371783|nr:SLC13 family permease [Luteimonas sp. 8-5]MDG6349352.1 SLC13 family permease [Luteimonas sp. 8-5]
MAALDWQGWLTIGVVMATLGLLLWERFTPDKVLMGAVAVLIASGILGPREALAGFWNPGVLTVAVLFVLVAALKSTGAIRWIGDWVLGRPRGEGKARARLIVITAPLSAFINNTPIVAMLTSAIEHWGRRSHIAPSKLLLPMNYATVLGGMCTLVGTSTNLIVAGLVLQQEGMPALTMFTPLGVGAVAAVAGGSFLLLAGRWFLPDRRSAFDQASDTHEYVVEMMVEADGPVDGKTIGDARLRQLEGSFLVELVRAGELHVAVAPGQQLSGGDRLVFIGATDAVRELRRVPGLRPATDQCFKIDDAGGQRKLVEVVMSAYSPAVGRTLVESAFRSRYNAAVIAVARRGTRLHGKLGELVLQAGDTLLLETDGGFAQRHANTSDFLIVNEIDGAARVDRPRALTALAVIGLMVVANTVFDVDILVSALVAALLVLLAGCVHVLELRRSVDLRLIAVIACSFALGAALERSGVAAVAASHLLAWSGGDPFRTLVLVYVAAVIFTELITNNAAAVLIFPIAMASAAQLGSDPMPFVIATMIGASAGFITPIGYQTNMMVYGPGGYRFTDYVRLGLPLSLVVGTAVLYAIPYFWPF